MDKLNVVVIGGGPGGYVAAIKAAHLGLKVALVEKDALGGTCLNRGCIPTKALVKSADVWRELNNAAEYGLKAGEVSFDFAQVMERKNKIVANLVAGIEQLVKSNKIQLYKGIGEVEEPGKVIVVPESGEREVLETENIIIATGSVPARPPIPGLELPGVMTSDEALENHTLPRSLVIIGGGVIGMEFASVYNSFGVKVTVVEMLPGILPTIDEEFPRRATPLFKRAGIEIITKASVKAIKAVGEEFAVLVDDGKGEREISCGQVLVSTGRRPSLQGINIEKLGLRVDRGALVVDAKMSTGVNGIYAIGDAVGGIMLAHVASAEGLVAAENCAGKASCMDYTVVPNCIFTHPEIAGVGLTEQEAKAQGVPYKTSKFPFTANGKAMTMGENTGTVKLIAHGETGLLLGGHIMGPHATDLIHELAVAIKNGLTGSDVAHTIHAHPTLSEAVLEAAEGLVGKPLHLA